MKSPIRTTFKYLIAALAMVLMPFAAQATSSDSGFCDCSAGGELLCHVPPGNHDNPQTIRVGDPALTAHLNHGDTLGACPGDTNLPASCDDDHHHDNNGGLSCTCTDGTVGTWYHMPAPSLYYSQRVVHGH